MSVLLIIIKKEIKTALRNSVFLFTTALILLLLVTGAIGGYLNYKAQRGQIQHVRQEKREQWLNQGEKHPHIAAHYGTFVFKPKTALSFFEFGLDAYTGSSIYLEAHYQHEFMFRPAQDFGAMIRFGELSIALVLLLLIPLLIIFLAFPAVAQERENGTLKIVLSQGITLGTLVWGKIIACLVIIIGLLLPAILILTCIIFAQPEVSLSADTVVRTLLLLTTYGAYFFVFNCASVWVSLKAQSSKNALLLLLSVWIVLTVVLPKTVASIAANSYPLPSLNKFEAEIADDLDRHIERNPTKDTLILNFTRRLLKQYQVDSIAQLPINYEAAYAQVYEDLGNRIHDKHSAQLLNRLRQQNQLIGFAGLTDPYLAMRSISMGLSGTDFETYADFQKKAEDYRRYLIRRMNNDYRDHSKTGEFYEYKAGRRLWESIVDFDYQSPAVGFAFRHLTLQMIALAVWVAAAIALTFISTRRAVP